MAMVYSLQHLQTCFQSSNQATITDFLETFFASLKPVTLLALENQPVAAIFDFSLYYSNELVHGSTQCFSMHSALVQTNQAHQSSIERKVKNSSCRCDFLTTIFVRL